MRKKNIVYYLSKYFFSLLYIFIVLLIVFTSNPSFGNVTSNINTVKSINSFRIIGRFDNIKLINSINDIKTIGTNQIINFEGTLTGYGPDCKGCTGYLYCSPHPNVLNGNIYYNDKEYGKIRIVAADYSIPCGSIVKISNYKFIGEEFYAIVLDRGSSIVGLTMDLLYNSEDDTLIIGRQYNILFSIVRIGY